MAQTNPYLGVSFNNLRKALYMVFFGIDEVEENGVKKSLACDFSSPKYKYIIPMQGTSITLWKKVTLFLNLNRRTRSACFGLNVTKA